MTDCPDEQKTEVKERTESPQKARQESAIGNNSNQNAWGTANEISHKNDIHPSEVEGIKAIDSFGIDFGDGAILTAKGLASRDGDSVRESKEESSKEKSLPAVSTEKMMQIAEKEHDHPTRWKTPPPKCNLYLDTVASSAGMKLPWKSGHPPTSGDMNRLLEKSGDFDQVWKTDFSDDHLSLENFNMFEMRPGDLVIWDTPDVSHSAIATAARTVIYAGSATAKNGCGHCDIKYYTGDKEPTNYGAPTAIYRYKNMTK